MPLSSVNWITTAQESMIWFTVTDSSGQVCTHLLSSDPTDWFRLTPCHQASADETVQVSLDPDVQTKVKLPPPITHPKQVRCILSVALTDVGEPYLITGSEDTIRVYDLSTFDEPELIREVDAHWHDILTLRLWMRRSVGDDGYTRVEPWIVSSSLDGTIRKWRLLGTRFCSLSSCRYSNFLSELVTPPSKAEPVKEALVSPPENFDMTEEEERELADLMDED